MIRFRLFDVWGNSIFGRDICMFVFDENWKAVALYGDFNYNEEGSICEAVDALNHGRDYTRWCRNISEEFDFSELCYVVEGITTLHELYLKCKDPLCSSLIAWSDGDKIGHCDTIIMGVNTRKALRLLSDNDRRYLAFDEILAKMYDNTPEDDDDDDDDEDDEE